MNEAPQLPHDIYGLAAYPEGLPWLWVFVAFALLSLVASVLYWWFKVRQKVPEPVVVDPWQVLKDELLGLAPEQPFHRAKQMEFYFHLSLAVRKVIERRTGLRATDMTLRELREPLRQKVPLPKETVKEMETFFERADMVKFADAEASVAQADEDHRKAMQWFEKLRPLSIHEGTKLYGMGEGA